MARDIAHAKISEIFEQTGKLPQYVKARLVLCFVLLLFFFPNSVAEDHPIYYAGPAKSAPERSQLWLPVRLIPHLDG